MSHSYQYNFCSIPKSIPMLKSPGQIGFLSHNVFCYCCFTVKTTFRKTSLIRYLWGSWNFPLPTGITSLIQQRYWWFSHLKHFWQAPVQPAQLGRQPGGSRAASSPEPQLLCLFSWFSWTVPDESSGVSGCHGSAWARVAKCQLHSETITWYPVHFMMHFTAGSMFQL